MKETEEETYERCLSIIAKQEYGVKEHENLFDDERAAIAQKVAMLYHSERLKSSLPSEQEWNKEAIAAWEKHPLNRMDSKGINPSAFVLGWQSCKEYILELLTKGDR